MKRFQNLKEKKGWVSLMTIMVLSVMLPIFLFFYVELNHYYLAKDKLDYVTQNMASSAVRQLDEQALVDGEIVIDEESVKTVARALMRQDYNLNNDLTVGANSSLLSTPEVRVHVLTPNESIQIDGKTITAENPSVVVVTAVKPTNIFFKRFITLRSFSMYDATTNKVVSNEVVEETLPEQPPADEAIVNDSLAVEQMDAMPVDPIESTEKVEAVAMENTPKLLFEDIQFNLK